MLKLTKTKIILIVLGEPNSTFSELLFKFFNSIKFKRIKKKVVLIGSAELLKKQMKFLDYKVKLNQISDIENSDIRKINIINVNFKFKTPFSNISKVSNKYIQDCFNLSLKLIKDKKAHFLINGPISKKHFLKKKFPGITEYIAKKTNSSDPVMLIYNELLSVSPLTTHVPIKNVSKFVKKQKIIKNVIQINKFYKDKLGKGARIAILGLNPHCETTDKISEEKTEIVPAIKFLIKKQIKIVGPLAADTFFLEKNLKRFDVVLGMYHDQVLSPIKTLFKFNAINITIGLPFIKITPDHGPNFEMIGENKSDPSSIFYALNFLNKIK
tara:strand:+ start:401 stop:1378 length:978 start_codon:yes stop_codon:yes gene_type:complete